MEALLSIKLQIQHLRDMLDDISVILRQEESPPPLKPVPTDAVHLVSQIIDKASVSVAEAHHLRFETQGDLAAVTLDPNLVTTIVRNLLSNAIKFSPAGSEIRLSLSRAAHQVVLRVSDDGIGIPHDEQNLIFETFYRARNASHIPGMGLGLSVVREYVGIHLGSVEVDSAEGKGATFTVWLPCELTTAA
jgi:signal transduction histidine kinase